MDANVSSVPYPCTFKRPALHKVIVLLVAEFSTVAPAPSGRPLACRSISFCAIDSGFLQRCLLALRVARFKISASCPPRIVVRARASTRNWVNLPAEQGTPERVIAPSACMFCNYLFERGHDLECFVVGMFLALVLRVVLQNHGRDELLVARACFGHWLGGPRARRRIPVKWCTNTSVPLFTRAADPFPQRPLAGKAKKVDVEA